MTTNRGQVGAAAGADHQDGAHPRRTSALLLRSDHYCVVSVPFGPAPGASGLTKAEAEVARLAVVGYSNRAIAELRGSSVRTVANQMAAILQKLGVTSRVQLAARLQETVTSRER